MSRVLDELFEAMKQGCHGDVAALLMTCGDDVNSILRRHTAITWALELRADDDVVQLILAHPRFDPGVKNQSGRTGLWEAASDGRTNLVRHLLNLGAAVDEPDMQGVTPLSACAGNNRCQAARTLLEHGADVNSRDRNGDTPLHRACASGAHDVVDLLLADRNCDVNSRNNGLQTPLMVALPSAYNIQVKHQPISQSLSICRRLLDAGSDACAQDGHHQTALHERVRQGDIAGACLLLHHNPHIANIPDKQGKTAMTLALEGERPNTELARYLLFYGAVPSCLLSAISHRAHDRDAKMVMDPRYRQQVTAMSPNEHTSLYHKLRFLETFLASIFVTKETVSVLLGNDFLSDVLEDRNTLETASKGQSSNHASSTNPSVESATRELHTTTAGDVRDDSSDSSTTSSSSSRCLGEAVRCVRWSLHHSMSLQHQCRLAVRRSLGTRLTVGLHTLGLPEKLQHYLTLGIDPVRENPYQAAMLHVAVVEGDVGTMRRLLEEGVDPEVPFMESSPLTRAVEMEPDDSEPHSEADRLRPTPVSPPPATSTLHQHVSGATTTGGGGLGCHAVAAPDQPGPSNDDSDDVIGLLVRHGASWAGRDPQGDTPVHVAVTRGQWLVRKVTSPSRRLKGSEEKFVEAIGVKDSCGFTPLQNAVLAGHWPSTRILLKVLVDGLTLGSRLPVQNPAQLPSLTLGERIQEDSEDSCITPLHCAAAAGAARHVKVLLTLGAKVNAVDKLGNTPLHAAACRGQVYSRDSYSPGLGINHRPMLLLRCWPSRRSGPASPSCHSCGLTAQLKKSAFGGFGVEDASANLSNEEQGVSKDFVLSTKDTAGDGELHRSQHHQNFLHIPEVSYRETTLVLLSHGADVTMCNGQGLEPKHLAARYAVDFKS